MPNLYQEALIKSYANGSYSYLLNEQTPDQFERKVSEIDDVLLQFMLIQLGYEDDTDADPKDIALALQSLKHILTAIQSQQTQAG
jgi:hypothetical protein